MTPAMNKIMLIIKREYLTRVQKKSFIIMTLLTPLLIAGIYAVAIWFAVKDSDTKTIHVLDQSGLFEDKLPESSSMQFVYINEGLDSSKDKVKDGEFQGLIYIPDIDLADPEGITYYGLETLGATSLSSIRRAINREIQDIRYRESGIDRELLDSLRTNISIASFNLSGDEEKESNVALASGVGFFFGFLIYLIMIIYGTQVLRGVAEEKSSKIVEVIISSVKPFQLMAGKIIGIGAVGLTQFLFWIVLTSVLWVGISTIFGPEAMQSVAESQAGGDVSTSAMGQRAEMVSKVNESMESLNIPFLLTSFLIYFLGGYLFYAALFAMVGSAVDSEADAQQFTFPILMPIIFSFVLVGAILKDPNGSLAFWVSMIPFTSPITMMIRLPFGIPMWELVLSVVLLIGGFVFTTWFAGRVYRVGILMYGTKVNYKTLFKWFLVKN